METYTVFFRYKQWNHDTKHSVLVDNIPPKLAGVENEHKKSIIKKQLRKTARSGSTAFVIKCVIMYYVKKTH